MRYALALALLLLAGCPAPREEPPPAADGAASSGQDPGGTTAGGEAGESAPYPAAALDFLLASLAEPTAEQVAAVGHIEVLKAKPYGPPPFYFGVGGGGGDEQGSQDEDGAPKFAVQAIVVTPGGNTAVIVGTTHGVGDRIGGSGWRIERIDGKTRSVTVVDPRSGRSVTRSVLMSE